MVDLKDYLGASIHDSIETLEYDIFNRREALKKLFDLDLTSSGTYIVNLESLWKNEGENSTKTVFKGSLEMAIQTAEQDFLRENKRGDVQANYEVLLQITKNFSQVIPKPYWESYMMKNKS